LEISQQFSISESLEDPRWDTFVAQNSNGYHIQTSQWAQVKRVMGWKPLRMMIEENGRIIAGAQLLIHDYPVIGNVAYVVRAPLSLNNFEPNQSQFLFDRLLELGKSHNIHFFFIQPAMNDTASQGLLEKMGFLPGSLEISPSATIIIDTALSEDHLLAKMHRQTRQNINRSVRENIEVREGTVDDLRVFYDLYQSTAKRQKFTPYPWHYFTRMWEVFGTKNQIGLVLTYFSGQPVSALLLVASGQIASAKLLGWSGAYPEKRPNDALFWNAIRWAKKHQYRYFDFDGINAQNAKEFLATGKIPEQAKGTPDFIKLGFGGEVALLNPTYWYSPNRILRKMFATARPEIGKGNLASQVLEYFRKRNT